MDRRQSYLIIFLAELFVLIVMGIRMFINWTSAENIDVSITQWHSDETVYNTENGWLVEEKDAAVEEKTAFLQSPLIGLRKGTYRAEIEYSCSSEQICTAYSEEKPYALKAGEIRLGRNYDHISYDFKLTEDISDFQLIVYYDGQGYLQIIDITLAPSPFGMLRNMTIILFCFILADLCLLYSDTIRKHQDIVLGVGGIILLVSLPLFMDGIWAGDDLAFHLMRIEGIAQELRMGNIPVRISSAWIDGYGYPVSIYYGDLLLYVPAVMNLIGFSVTGAYKFYVFMINAGTAVIACYCMNRVYRDRRIALLTCFAYCTASYRLINVYARAAVGEYSAMMFLPLVAASVYKIYTDDVQDNGEYQKNATLLAVGMSGLIGTHILSTEMVVIVLVIVCLSLCRLTFRKETVRVWLTAVGETCLLSAYFIVPFLDYSLSVPSKIGAIVERGGAAIQASGVTLADYFAFFKPLQQIDFRYENTGRLLSPGIILMAALIVAVVFCIKRRSKADKTIKWLVFYACLTGGVTLRVFPWNELAAHLQMGNFLSQVQFPWRYISMLTIILTLLFGCLLAQSVGDRAGFVQTERIVLITGFVMTCFFTTRYMEGTSYFNAYCGEELNRYSVGTGEYLRDGTNRDMFKTLSSDIFSERMNEVSIISRRGCNMRIRCVASDEEGFIWIPLFHYKGYHVTDDDGNEYPIKDGYANQIEVSVPIGFDGYLNVEFREPWYWRVSELISVLVVLWLCMSCRKYHNKIRLN